jgi:hypothetical protein
MLALLWRAVRILPEPKTSAEIGLHALETDDISAASDGQALIVKTEGRIFRIQIGIIRGE